MHHKSIKMRSRTLWAASWKQVGAGNTKSGACLSPGAPFFIIYVDLGRFGGPFKIQGGTKNDKKKEYGDFLAPRGDQEVPKSRFWRGLEKGTDFGWNFGRKMGGPEGSNHQNHMWV